MTTLSERMMIPLFYLSDNIAEERQDKLFRLTEIPIDRNEIIILCKKTVTQFIMEKNGLIRPRNDPFDVIVRVALRGPSIRSQDQRSTGACFWFEAGSSLASIGNLIGNDRVKEIMRIGKYVGKMSEKLHSLSDNKAKHVILASRSDLKHLNDLSKYSKVLTIL